MQIFIAKRKPSAKIENFDALDLSSEITSTTSHPRIGIAIKTNTRAD
jgi:hypothetical protein